MKARKARNLANSFCERVRFTACDLQPGISVLYSNAYFKAHLTVAASAINIYNYSCEPW